MSFNLVLFRHKSPLLPNVGVLNAFLDEVVAHGQCRAYNPIGKVV